MLVTTMEKPAVVARQERTGEVHCLICSHRVPAQVLIDRRSARVKSGEKCVRCGSSLESGYVVALKQAA